MIALDMNMPDACWHCKFSIGHAESKCFFTKDFTDDSYYSKHKRGNCPLVDIKEDTDEIN